jgi:hypothetical protein
MWGVIRHSTRHVARDQVRKVMPTLPLVLSSDSHVFEPPDLWQTRIDAVFRDRAPRIERIDGGDHVVVEADQILSGIGLISNAGARFEAPETISAQGRFEDVHRRGYEPEQPGEEADETGIVVAGKDKNGHGYVLAEISGRYPPTEWARLAITAYATHGADRIVAEVNNGGDTLRMVDPNVAFTAVRASRGKVVRAEPVAALYQRAAPITSATSRNSKTR